MPTITIPHRRRDDPCLAGEYADLRDAVVKAVAAKADLTGANLRGANLMPIKHDFIAAILYLPDEIPFLRDALIAGKIDGSTYTGECACLAGTMAHACHIGFNDFRDAQRMPINANSPRERWFTGIKPGDTPDNSAVAEVTLEWIDEALGMVARIRGVAPVLAGAQS